jgi:hypothetical protein
LHYNSLHACCRARHVGACPPDTKIRTAACTCHRFTAAAGRAAAWKEAPPACAGAALPCTRTTADIIIGHHRRHHQAMGDLQPIPCRTCHLFTGTTSTAARNEPPLVYTRCSSMYCAHGDQAPEDGGMGSLLQTIRKAKPAVYSQSPPAWQLGGSLLGQAVARGTEVFKLSPSTACEGEAYRMTASDQVPVTALPASAAMYKQTPAGARATRRSRWPRQ